MNKKLQKLLPVWVAIAAVLLIAGIVLMAVLGFNNGADRPENYTVEVGYGVSVDIDEEGKTALVKACDDAFSANGVKPSDVKDIYGVNTAQDRTVRSYTFTGVEREKLVAAKTAIEGALEGVDVAIHENSMLNFSEVIWRSALAVGVGVIVGLIYLGIRFGIGSALTGLTASAVGGVLPACIVAIARIPVYSGAPVFYAAIGALATLLLWIAVCMKLRDQKKSEVRPEPSEAVSVASREALPAVVAISVALVAILVIVGAVASAGVRALVLPALLSVAAAVYSVLLFAPALHVPVKAAFDKLAAKRKPRYQGKKSEKKED